MELREISSEYVAGGVVSVPFLVLILKRLFTLLKREDVASKREDVALNAAGAQIDVIELLRAEVRRLGEINNDLAGMVNDLQRENIGLKNEISTLHNTINQMNEQLNNLSRRNSDPAYTVDRRSGENQ